jgi:hypothetical protein
MKKKFTRDMQTGQPYLILQEFRPSSCMMGHQLMTASMMQNIPTIRRSQLIHPPPFQ